MTQNINQQMSSLDILTLISLSILWGGSFFFVEVLIDQYAPLTIVALRVGLAAIGLWALVVALGLEVPKSGKHWIALFVLGLLNNALPFCLIAWGQTQISSGLASIFNAMTPFFTVIVAGALLADERITTPKLVGVLAGLVGAIVLIGPEVLGGMSGSTLGQLAVMLAAISYAFAAAYARRFRAWGISPLIVATGQVTTATLIMAPLAIVIDQPWNVLDMQMATAGAVIGLSLFSTVIAYVLYFRLIDSAGATNAALVTFLIPISAILLGVLFLHEAFSIPQAIGMAVIGAGLLIMDGRPWKWLTSSWDVKP